MTAREISNEGGVSSDCQSSGGDTIQSRTTRPTFGVAKTAAEKQLAYARPGNARELQNYIERPAALTGYERLTVEDLPEKIRNSGPLPGLAANSTHR